MKLLSLPHELLGIIFSQLCHTDLRRIRQTCQVLEMMSHNRDVWVAIFWNFVQQPNMPMPFFLPKPLTKYSARELEKIITKWDAKWPETISIKATRVPFEKPDTRFKGYRSFLTPGGRWFIMATDDGSIRYFDLHQQGRDDLRPRTLIPPPIENSLKPTELEWVNFDADFTAPSNTNHSCQLREFHIATCLSYRISNGNPNDRGPLVSRVNVWHVHATLDDEEDSGRVGVSELRSQCLSTVVAPHLIPCDLHLLGDQIAYISNYDVSGTERGVQAIEVVNWSDPAVNGPENSDGENQRLHERWIIDLDVDANVLDVRLIPAGKVLVLLEAEYTEPRTLHLYDYVKDSRRTMDLDDFEQLGPSWSSDDVPEGAMDDQWQTPLPELSLMIGGESRLIARHSLGLYSICIPTPAYPLVSAPAGNQLDSPTMQRLCTSNDGPIMMPSEIITSHHNRTVDLCQLRAYHHPPDTPSELRESVIDCEEGTLDSSPYRNPPAYDVFSHRVVEFCPRNPGPVLYIVDFLV